MSRKSEQEMFIMGSGPGLVEPDDWEVVSSNPGTGNYRYHFWDIFANFFTIYQAF